MFKIKWLIMFVRFVRQNIILESLNAVFSEIFSAL